MSDHPYGSTSGRNFGYNALQTAHYKGFEIVETEHHGTFDNFESFGMKVDKAYTVVDEMGEQTLPLLYNRFWSPTDAAQAIDAALWLQQRVELKHNSWATSTTHEYHQMLAYRRNFFRVFQALREMEDLCIESRELDENPRDAILGRLQLLRLESSR